MIELSVVVVTWETRELLLACLASVDREIAPLGPRAERIVVDNGSRDGTAAAVRAQHPEVEVIELPRNRGYAVAANAGIAKSAGRVVLLLNSDARLEAGAVSTVLGELARDPRAAAAGLQLVDAAGAPRRSIHALPGFWTECLPSWWLELAAPRRFPSHRSRRVRESASLPVAAVLGAALFLRREAIEQVGPLDEGYFFFLEETDWCWRAAQAGWRVLHVPGARAFHVSGASSKRRFPIETRIEYHRSLYRFVARRGGAVVRAGVVGLRVLRAAIGVPLALLGAPFSTGQRQRLVERVALLGWHLRGCPDAAGLRTVDAGARTRKAPRPGEAGA